MTFTIRFISAFPLLFVSLTALATPSVFPSSLDFSSSPQTQTVTITNPGGGKSDKAILISPTIAPSDAAFEVGTSSDTPCPLGTPLDLGKTCKLTVTFKGTTGTSSATLTVSPDFPNLTIALTGTAQNTESKVSLTVTKNGAGQVTSNPSGIDCGATCNGNFTANFMVMLTATADSNSTFTGWSGDDCSGNYVICYVTMNTNKNVTATFTSNQPSPIAAHLVNISTRAYTSTDLSSVIAGFIIQGTGFCTVMIRGFGKGIGLSPQLDSQLLLQVFPYGTPIISNQSWLVGNDPNQIPPILHLPDSSDAGILITLVAGAYTATMTPESDIGIGLIGVDQVSCDANTQLVNISTRAEVRDNLEVVIAGFIIDGPGTVRVMLRGFGAGAGLSPCLDTHLKLETFPAAEWITENEDWATAANASQIPDILKLPNYTDAGILIDLPAGAYTATMTRTANSCIGIGLIGVDVVQ